MNDYLPDNEAGQAVDQRKSRILPPIDGGSFDLTKEALIRSESGDYFGGAAPIGKRVNQASGRSKRRHQERRAKSQARRKGDAR